MRLYELLNPNAQKQMADLDQGQNPEEDPQGKFDASKVDANLQNIAQGVDDQNAQPDLPQGVPAEDPELNNQNPKPIDDALLAKLKTLPYNKWPIPDKSPISAMNIAAMDLAGLSNLLNSVRYKAQMVSMKDRIDLNDNHDMEFYNDLMKFINTVSTFKKTNTKAQLAQTNPTPTYQTMRPSK